ncbi:MAG: DUF2169 domain-containing protein [Myxococcales bacterium]|nr:DUF2169 domain-containing protein [Myxococcales bacterium]
MRKKNLTPFLFGYKATSRKPPQPEVTCVVRGRFLVGKDGSLTPHEDQGALTGDVWDEEDDERTGGLVRASDFADLKLKTDVLVTGLCFAGKRPVTESVIRLQVADRLTVDRRIFGPRAWTGAAVGSAFTDPLPFTTMPLGWANAFGGAGVESNPGGKGVGTPELPNVEWADPIRSPADRPEPACPGPVSPTWPARARKVGKAYGKEWQKERAPFYAEDFDWSYFQAAPESQQLDGYLRGDEELTLVNLHPEAAELRTRLPRLRLRTFLRDHGGTTQEVSMVLDTLHVASDEASIYLTWRGVGRAADVDLSSLAFAIIASEPLGDRALPASFYEGEMAAFVDDPTGLRDAMPKRAREILDAVEKGPAPKDASLDPVSQVVQEKLGHIAPETAEALVAALKDALPPARAALEQAAEEAKKAGRPAPASLDEELAKAVAEASKERRGFPGSLSKEPRVDLSGVASEARAAIDRVKADADAAEKAGVKRVEELAQLEEVERALRSPELVRLDPSLGESPPPLPPEPAPYVDLTERDLSGRDLSGRDLSGAKLVRANLSGANLRRANLRGADLRGAILIEADLEDADLTGAKLEGAIASKVVARRVKLAEAELTRALFGEADLENATLEGAKATQLVLVGANLRGLNAKRAQLTMSLLSEADLTDADFSEATLLSTTFGQAKAFGAKFSGAQLGKTSFEGAELEGARFRLARGDAPRFLKAKLDRVDFSGVVFPRAHFSEATGKGANFTGANLLESRFYRAEMPDTVFERANLHSAELGRAKVSGSSFRDANLYDAKLVGTAGSGCDFLGANLKRSTLEGA